MPGPTTEVPGEDIKGPRADLLKFAFGLTELRQEVRGALGLARWAGTILVATLLTSGIGAIMWGASLTAKVYGLESRTVERFQDAEKRAVERFQDAEKRSDERHREVNARLDKMDARFDKVDARFDRLEASIFRLLEQTRPATKPAP